MNWKLILQLSLFGLVMGMATVYIIPSSIEFFFWLPVFIISAYFIAKLSTGSFFANGFMVGVVNSIWISAAHVILFDAYIARHAMEAAQYHDPRMPVPPKVAMFVIGIVIGILSGLVIGLFAFIASKIVKSKPTAI